MPHYTPEDWQRVADTVKGRRNALGLTQPQAAEASGGAISRPVWSNLERNAQANYKPRSLAGVCRALSWTPDSIDRILAGDEPVDVEERPDLRTRVERLEASLVEIRALLEELRESP